MLNNSLKCLKSLYVLFALTTYGGQVVLGGEPSNLSHEENLYQLEVSQAFSPEAAEIDSAELACQLHILALSSDHFLNHAKAISTIEKSERGSSLERLVPLVIPIVIGYWMHHRHHPNGHLLAKEELENTVVKCLNNDTYFIEIAEAKLKKLFTNEEEGGCLVTRQQYSSPDFPIPVDKELQIESSTATPKKGIMPATRRSGATFGPFNNIMPLDSSMRRKPIDGSRIKKQVIVSNQDINWRSKARRKLILTRRPSSSSSSSSIDSSFKVFN